MDYTKGEWYWEYNDQHHHNLRAKSTHPSGVEEDKHILFISPDFLGEDSLTNEADANLIKAAPALYEALKAVDDYLSAPYPENMNLKQIAADKLVEALAQADRRE